MITNYTTMPPQDRSLTKAQFDRYYASNPNYGGCMLKADLPKSGPQGHFWIINMANITGKFAQPNGSHWVLGFDCPCQGQFVYFDPFGICAPPAIARFAELSEKPVLHTTCDLQSIDSSQCGYFCIIMARELQRGRNPEDILTHLFHAYDPKYNEELVSKFPSLDAHEKELVHQVHELGKHLCGQGFLSRIKENRFLPNFIKRRIHTRPRTSEPQRFAKTVDDNNLPIIKISYSKDSVAAPVQAFINTLSLGRYANVKKKLGYDDVYHAFLYLTLSNHKVFRVEKNTVAVIKQVPDHTQGKFNIPIHKSITLKQFIANAAAGHKDFWLYRARDNNCQNFTKNLIERNGLADNPEVSKEIKPQNGHALVDSIPAPLRFIPNLATDAGGVVDRIITGDGLSKEKITT